jgi:regulator of sirC expression with transglutaminase-like and TPR domain
VGGRQRLAGALECCNKAVARVEMLKLPSWQYRFSRGLALALTGNSDEAIKDFQVYLDHCDDPTRKQQRVEWIDALRKGEKPFTKDVLESLAYQ